MIRSTMKPIFQRYQRICCTYESLRRLDLQIWRFLCWRRRQTKPTTLPLAHVCGVIMYMYVSVFSPSKIQGMTGGSGLGEVCGHIKAFGFSLFPTSKEILYWRLVGPICLMHTRENTVSVHVRMPSHFRNAIIVGYLTIMHWSSGQ